MHRFKGQRELLRAHVQQTGVNLAHEAVHIVGDSTATGGNERKASKADESSKERVEVIRNHASNNPYNRKVAPMSAPAHVRTSTVPPTHPRPSTHVPLTTSSTSGTNANTVNPGNPGEGSPHVLPYVSPRTSSLVLASHCAAYAAVPPPSIDHAANTAIAGKSGNTEKYAGIVRKAMSFVIGANAMRNRFVQEMAEVPGWDTVASRMYV